MRSLIGIGLSCWLALAAPGAPGAERSADRLLREQRDALQLPGVGRVVAAFLVTAGLAVAAVWALRRYHPRFASRPMAGSSVRVIERRALGAAAELHVLEIEGRRVLVVDGRHGVAMTVLPSPPAAQA